MESKENKFNKNWYTIERIVNLICLDSSGRYIANPEGWTLLSERPLLRTFDYLCRYIEDNLCIGRAVHIRGLGTFSFINKERRGNALREDSHGHTNYVQVPAFKLDEALRDEAQVSERPVTPRTPKYMSSVWQSAAQPVFVNPVTIAHRSGEDVGLVRAALDDLALAICDLIKRNANVDVDFQFCRVIYDNQKRRIDMKPHQEFVEIITRALGVAKGHNLHSTSHREYFESPSPVSARWHKDLRLRQLEQRTVLGRPSSAPPKVQRSASSRPQTSNISTAPARAVTAVPGERRRKDLRVELRHGAIKGSINSGRGMSATARRAAQRSARLVAKEAERNDIRETLGSVVTTSPRTGRSTTSRR